MSRGNTDPLFRNQDLIPQNLQQKFQERHISGAHQILEDAFKEYYHETGYVEVPPLDLISDKDNSVLFTGASISAVKDILLSGNFPEGTNGVYLAQECLRTKALKYAFKNDWIPYGQLYFKMVTILSKPERFEDVVREAIDFTQNKIGVDSSRIKLRSSRNFHGLSEVDTLTDVAVDYDTQPENYYQWKYGIDGVYGEGLTVCIFNPATSKWFDVGNIIKIYDSHGQELGIEFGYGYEFFLTAVLGIDQALKLSKVFECFEFTPGLAQKYYSTLEAVAMMKLAGAQLGSRGVDHIYKQYLKAIQFMAESLSKDVEEIIAEMSVFISHIHRGDFDLDAEVRFMQEHKKRKVNFAGIVKRVGVYLWALEQGQKPKQLIREPSKLIHKYLVTNGIDPLEVESLLQKLSRFNIFEQS